MTVIVNDGDPSVYFIYFPFGPVSNSGQALDEELTIRIELAPHSRFSSGKVDTDIFLDKVEVFPSRIWVVPFVRAKKCPINF